MTAPADAGLGRRVFYEDLRWAWAVRVRTALNGAESLRAAAAVLGHHDPAAAAGLVEAAHNLVETGAEGKSAGLPSREESVAEWGRLHGGSWDDPAVRDKVYKAVAEERKMVLERAERAARAQAQSAAASAKLRRRRR